MTTARFLRRPGGRRVGRRCGLTLVDAVITVMIIGILTAVATPKFVDALLYHRAVAAARRIKADLQWGRQHAVSASSDLRVQFESATNSYTIPALKDLDRPGQAYSVDLTEYPYNSTIVSASCGADEELLLSRYGTPDSGGTITIQSGKYTRTVTIDAITGKVSIP